MLTEPLPSFSPGRKWLLALNLIVSLVAVLLLVLEVNYLSARHFKRIPLAASAQVELSSLTRRIIQSVTNELKVIVFFDQTSPLFEPVKSLLKEYRLANNNIVVKTIDYNRQPSDAELLKGKYKLSEYSDKNVVIFDHAGRQKIVNESELSTLDIQPLVRQESREVRRTHFKGELMFSSAIYSLVNARPLKAYFLQGHKEHPPENNDAAGYSRFATLLEQNNIEWAPLQFSGTNGVPADCNLLVIAGPRTPLLQPELERIAGYLASGGRSLILFSFHGLGKNKGLAQLLSEYGVAVGENLVLDPASTVNGEDIRVRTFGPHPTTNPLHQSQLQLALVRSVSKQRRTRPAADAPEVTELLYTTPGGTIITDFRDGTPVPHPGRDAVTNVALAVAVEKGRIKGVTADRGTTRLVVVGDSGFLGNQLIEAGSNSDFASLAINWLLDRTELLSGLRPRPFKEYQITLTGSQLRSARLILLLGMPGTVFATGFLVWIRRRK